MVQGLRIWPPTTLGSAAGGHLNGVGDGNRTRDLLDHNQVL